MPSSEAWLGAYDETARREDEGTGPTPFERDEEGTATVIGTSEDDGAINAEAATGVRAPAAPRARGGRRRGVADVEKDMAMKEGGGECWTTTDRRCRRRLDVLSSLETRSLRFSITIFLPSLT